MRCLLTVFILLIGTLSCSAQKTYFPKIVTTGKSFEEFVPMGWAIKDTVTGDLNKDKVDDAAIMLEDQVAVKETNRDSLIDNKNEQRPRILLILFRVGDHYELKVQQNTFILRDGERGDNDPYSGMEISKGLLHVNFEILGKDGRQVLNYMFRYQAGYFYLIGATNEESNDSGTTSSDFNFSTGKYIYKSSGPAGSNQKDEEVIKTFPAHKLKKLSELSEPFDYRVFGGEVI